MKNNNNKRCPPLQVTVKFIHTSQELQRKEKSLRINTEKSSSKVKTKQGVPHQITQRIFSPIDQFPFPIQLQEKTSMERQ